VISKSVPSGAMRVILFDSTITAKDAFTAFSRRRLAPFLSACFCLALAPAFLPAL